MTFTSNCGCFLFSDPPPGATRCFQEKDLGLVRNAHAGGSLHLERRHSFQWERIRNPQFEQSAVDTLFRVAAVAQDIE